MTGKGDGRGISTVADVTMALLLISASVAVFALYLDDSEPESPDPGRTSATAQTLSSATMNVSYTVDEASVNPLLESTPGVEGLDGPATRDTHGTVTQLMADAAASSVRISYDGSSARPAAAPGRYRRSVEGGLLTILTALDVDAQVIAIWRPYPGSELESRVEVGPTPPRDEDVSLTTMTVPSGLPPVDETRLERAYRRGGYDGAASVVADAMVRGYFPPEETQLALEDGGINRKLTVYRYIQLGTVLEVQELHESVSSGTIYAHDEERPLLRYGANATDANRQLSEALASNVIREDIAAAAGEWATDPGADRAETLSDSVSVGEVIVVIKTWQ